MLQVLFPLNHSCDFFLRSKNYIIIKQPIYTRITFTTLLKKLKFPIQDFFCKCNQIRRKLRIWSHFLKESLMETSFFVSPAFPLTFRFLWLEEKLDWFNFLLRWIKLLQTKENYLCVFYWSGSLQCHWKLY